jgi:D-glycero-D-manno-heptose 1,7-bisphosphate phosphatase
VARPHGRARAVLLDRDGTIVLDRGYARDPAEVALVEGAAEGLQQLRAQGLRLVLVSNQSGVGRGLIAPAELDAVHARMVGLLAQAGVRLDGAYYCLHAPWDGCECRKPAPGLLLRAARELDLDLAGSLMVGDRDTDVRAGEAAGCRAIRFEGWAGVVEHAAATVDA